MWGETNPTFEKVEGSIEIIEPLPPEELLIKQVGKNPDIARLNSGLELSKTVLALEKANQIPDLTISGGVKRSNEIGEYGFIMGISLPVPIFDRNQGGLGAAKYNLARAEEEQKAAELRAGLSLGETYQKLGMAHNAVSMLKDLVLPDAEKAFKAAESGYQHGRNDYLDVLDAQRTLFEARIRHLDAAAGFHFAMIEIHRLIGVDMELLDPFLREISKGVDDES